MKIHNYLKVISIPVTAIAFFFAIYVPMVAYVNNSQEFLQVRPWLLFGASLCVFSMLWILLVILFLLLKNASLLSRYALAILCGLTVAFYVQGNLINLNYGVLDGREIPWDKMVGAGIINTIVWIIILAGFISFAFLAKKNFFGLLKVVMMCFLGYIALILSMRCATVKSNSTYPVDFSMKDFMTLSKEHNIIVFIVDTFEQSLFEEILNKYPDTKNMLKGFTYYKNTIGKFPTTKGALPHILTGVANDNSVPFVEYKEKAFLESPIYQEAIKKDFLVDVYAKAVFAPTESTIDAVGVVKNVSFVKPELKDVVNYFIDTYNSSVFSYLPHFLKKHFMLMAIPRMEVVRENAVELDAIKIERSFFKEAENNFYKLSLIENGKRLKFFHFWGVHAPGYTLDKGYECLKNISKYLNRAKKLLTSDKMDVVIMADHGFMRSERPMFLCSNTNEAFIVDTKPFSYDDFSLVLSGAMNGRRLKVPQTEHVRTFFRYFWDREWDAAYLPKIFKIKYDLNGFNVISDELTPKNIYSGNDFTGLGLTGFTIDGTPPNSWLWTVGKTAMIKIPILPEYIKKSMNICIKSRALLNDRLNNQELRILVNGNYYSTETYNYPNEEHKDLNVIVPGELNTNKIVQLQFIVKSPITADFWNPPNPGTRPLGVMMTQFSLSLFEPQAKFEFSTSDPSTCRLTSGFAGGERYGRWTQGTNAVMEISLPVEYHGSDIKLDMTVHPFLYGSKVKHQRMTVSCNNEIVCDKVFTVGGVQPVEIMVPSKMTKKGMFKLSISVPDCASPKELGMSDDPRKLAVFFRTCEMKAVEKK